MCNTRLPGVNTLDMAFILVGHKSSTMRLWSMY